MIQMGHEDIQQFLTQQQISDLEVDGAIEWVEYHQVFILHDLTRFTAESADSTLLLTYAEAQQHATDGDSVNKPKR